MSPVELFFLKRARRVHHNKPKRRRKLPPKQRAVVFETLEPRILLDAAPLMVDMAALGNDLTVKQTGANIEVLDNTSTVVASHAAADTSQVVVHGENGVDDSLAIDYSTPFFIDLSFDGGTGSGDSLTIHNGNFDSVTYDVTGPQAGTIGLTAGASSATITYSGLEPLTNTGTAANVVFNLPAGPNQAVLEDNGNSGDNMSQLRSANASFELTTFTNPSGSLTVNFGNNDDTLTLNTLDPAFYANLNIIGGTGNDDIIFEAKTGSGTYTINGASGTDTIEATANANFTLTDSQLSIGSEDIALVSIEDADLTGGGSENTFSVRGWTGSGTLAGAGGSDTVVATKNANFTLTNASVATSDGMNLALSSIEAANLTGGAGDNTFTLNGWTGTAHLSGLGGNDSYAFGLGGFGTVEIDGNNDAGTDTLDFTGLGVAPVLTVTNGEATISNGVDTITQTGGNAEEIDATLVDLGAGVDGVSTLQQALDDLLAFVRQIKEAQGDLQALRNQLPLLDREQVAGLADVVALTGAFEKFVADAKTAISSAIKLSDVVEALNSLIFTGLPPPLSSLTLTVTTSYRGEDPDVDNGVDNRLELLLDFELDGTATKEFSIDLGETAQNIGATVDGKIAATGKLDADFSVGLSTLDSPSDTPTAFIVP